MHIASDTILNTGKKTLTGKIDAHPDPGDFATGPVTQMSGGETVQTWGFAVAGTTGEISNAHEERAGRRQHAGRAVHPWHRPYRLRGRVLHSTSTGVWFLSSLNSCLGGSNGVHNIVNTSGMVRNARHKGVEVSSISKCWRPYGHPIPRGCCGPSPQVLFPCTWTG